jgi:predicted Zn finger-like uncharacterized protein
MKFTCDKCSAQYMISDEKVGPNGVKVRCKKCGNVVVVRRASAEAAKVAPGVGPSTGSGRTDPLEPAAAASAPRPGSSGDGLDAELGHAFESAFGDTPAPAPAAPELGATHAMNPEEAAKANGRDPAPAATEWYVAIGEAQVGPLPLAEVKRKWEGGDVGPDSLVWRPGMADWAPLTTVGDLAAFLAPVSRASARNTVREEPKRAEAAAPAAASPRRDVSWTAGAGANALKDLADEELSAKPADPKPVAASAARHGANGKAGSLVDTMNLPDSGVDPTGAFELPIKGVERTEEKPVVKRSSVARGAEEIRHKRSANRAVVGGVVAAILLVGAATAGVLWYLDRRLDDVAVAAAPASLPPPVAAAPAKPAPAAPVAPAPEPKAAVASTLPPPAEAAVPVPAPETPAVAEAKPAEPEPESTRPRAVATAPKRPVRTEPARPARREPVRAPVTRTPEPAVATAEPTPTTPRESARTSGSLDFGGNDDALEAALGGGGGSGRSVYVPPKPGGTSGLPAKLTPAQINESVAGKVDALRRCVSEQKTREPDATGVIKMRWLITADGGPRDVKCLTPEYAQSQFAGCIGGVVRSIRFPRSATTGQEVTFPFSF